MYPSEARPSEAGSVGRLHTNADSNEYRNITQKMESSWVINEQWNAVQIPSEN